MNEDWLVSEELDSAAGAEGDDDFNDVLADAILKRPESIRVRAREERQETVFTFPSISSGFGNVDRNKGTARRVEVENREEMMVSGPTVSSRHGSTTVDDHHPAG